MISRRTLLIWSGSSLSLLGCGKGGDEDAACPKVPLSATSEQLRASLKYVERSPDATKICAGCSQYKPAVGGGCGGCNLFEGPVHPKGYCAAFAARA